MEVLYKVTNMFPIDELKKNLALLITKQGSTRCINAHNRIEKTLEIGPASDSHNLFTSKVKTLLKHLIDNKEVLIPYFPFPDAEGPCDFSPFRDQLSSTLSALRFTENSAMKFPELPKSMHFITQLAQHLNEDVERSLLTITKPKIVRLCQAQIEHPEDPRNIDGLQANVGAVKSALNLLKQTPEENITVFTQSLDRFFNDGLNVIQEYVKTLTFLKTLNPDLVYTKAAWERALQSTIDEIHVLINVHFERNGRFVSDFINGPLRNRVKSFCLAQINGRENDEENKILALQVGLNALTDSLNVLHNDLRENMMGVITPLSIFSNVGEENPLIQRMQSLIAFKAIKEDLHYPKEVWSQAFNPSVAHIEQSINTEREVIRVKEENKRLEEERIRQEEAARERAEREAERLALEEAARLEREEATRRAEEQHQAHLAELARAADAMERQRQEALEAARLEREEALRIAEQQRLAQEAAARQEREEAARRVDELEQLLAAQQNEQKPQLIKKNIISRISSKKYNKLPEDFRTTGTSKHGKTRYYFCTPEYK